MEEIINKIATSGIITINLEEFYEEGERVEFDIKQCLYEELILKEKDFREFIKSNDWSFYKTKLVAITCTVDAIVPTWAYMLVALALAPFAKRIYFSNKTEIDNLIFTEKLNSLIIEQYKDKRIIIKGCSDKPVPINAYVMLTAKLKPIAKSIMYGEPCSTVPLFKSK